MNQKLKDLRGRVETLRGEIDSFLSQAGPDLDLKRVDTVQGSNDVKLAYFRALNDELNEKVKELEPLQREHDEMSRAKQKLASLGMPAGSAPAFSEMSSLKESKGAPQMAIGDSFYEAWRMKNKAKHETFEIPDVGLSEIGVKTLLTTSAGWPPETTRTGRLVGEAIRPIQVIDLIPGGQTSQAAVVYMEETFYGATAGADTAKGAATEIAEAGTYPEARFELTEQTSPVRKIAVFLPVTDEQLEDAPQVRGYINNRLPFMVRQRLDYQILNGNGTAPNLRGIPNVVGVQTQARGTDPGPDAIYKAMVKVRVTGRANPSGLVMNPTDWQNIRLLRTADGLYIWGNPQEAGMERIWGLPIAQSDALTAGTALVGDFAGFSELTERRGVEVRVSDSHSTYFVEGKQAIRADMRVALVVYRPEAFTLVSGL